MVAVAVVVRIAEAVDGRVKVLVAEEEEKAD